MNHLTIFPVFILFMLSIFSIAGGTYYNGTIDATELSNITAGTAYGNDYYITANGTYVFVTNTTDFEITFHYAVNGSVWFAVNFSQIASIEMYTVHLENGTDINVNISQEYAQWVIATTTGSTHLSFGDWLLESYGMLPSAETSAFTGGYGTMTIGIVVITILMTIGVVAGLRAFGTGIAGISVEVLIKGTFYFGFWLILTELSAGLITAISYIGLIIYLGLTVMYLFGFVQSIGGGGDE